MLVNLTMYVVYTERYSALDCSYGSLSFGIYFKLIMFNTYNILANVYKHIRLIAIVIFVHKNFSPWYEGI